MVRVQDTIPGLVQLKLVALTLGNKLEGCTDFSDQAKGQQQENKVASDQEG